MDMDISYGKDDFGYELPKPGLCDDCAFASLIDGGCVGVGFRIWHQRYCMSPVLKPSPTIYFEGVDVCSSYQKLST